jgi:hypothetical protein
MGANWMLLIPFMISLIPSGRMIISIFHQTEVQLLQQQGSGIEVPISATSGELLRTQKTINNSDTSLMKHNNTVLIKHHSITPAVKQQKASAGMTTLGHPPQKFKQQQEEQQIIVIAYAISITHCAGPKFSSIKVLDAPAVLAHSIHMQHHNVKESSNSNSNS